MCLSVSEHAQLDKRQYPSASMSSLLSPHVLSLLAEKEETQGEQRNHATGRKK
jgi:hypothetical protein